MHKYRNKLWRLERGAEALRRNCKCEDPYAPDLFVRRPTRQYDSKVALKVISLLDKFVLHKEIVLKTNVSVKAVSKINMDYKM